MIVSVPGSSERESVRQNLCNRMASAAQASLLCKCKIAASLYSKERRKEIHVLSLSFSFLLIKSYSCHDSMTSLYHIPELKVVLVNGRTVYFQRILLTAYSIFKPGKMIKLVSSVDFVSHLDLFVLNFKE